MQPIQSNVNIVSTEGDSAPSILSRSERRLGQDDCPSIQEGTESRIDVGHSETSKELAGLVWTHFGSRLTQRR